MNFNKLIIGMIFAFFFFWFMFINSDADELV